jgi:uncharacterized membrane protein (DUF4010 family)
VTVAVTVAAVLFLGAREKLHALAKKVELHEITTTGMFLVLTGVILPLAPREPVTELTAITPHQVWLAVVAVSSVSYGSYLVQRFVSPRRGILAASVLGGLYSSTVTTVVLARRVRHAAKSSLDLQAGIVLATSLMYLRIAVIVAVFNMALARSLAPWFGGLFAAAALLSYVLHWRARGLAIDDKDFTRPKNPLELTSAAIFAGMFVLVSLATTWVQGEFGQAGVYALAALIGVTDIDPFVLSIAQGAEVSLGIRVMTIALVIAASSNNLLKAIYTVVFAGPRDAALPAACLTGLGLAGFALAFWVI